MLLVPVEMMPTMLLSGARWKSLMRISVFSFLGFHVVVCCSSFPMIVPLGSLRSKIQLVSMGLRIFWIAASSRWRVPRCGCTGVALFSVSSSTLKSTMRSAPVTLISRKCARSSCALRCSIVPSASPVTTNTGTSLPFGETSMPVLRIDRYSLMLMHRPKTRMSSSFITMQKRLYVFRVCVLFEYF